ncbi:MAG: hypothetical protein U1B83_04950, partial [Candidatus Cloacimonadaceae bacterium]|nr:hypothetical protein [Candidatus Cloacimonadaceae bacterium]
AVWRVANLQEIAGRNAIALSNYDLALAQYRSFADVGGEMLSLAGLARIHHAMADQTAFAQTRQSMLDIVEKIDPTQRYVLDLLDLHILMSKADYAGIADMAKDDKSLPLSARLQMLSFRLQADAFLGNANPAAARELAKVAKKTGRRLAKSHLILAHDTSRAYYALAYYYYANDPATARKHIAKALELDYLYEDFHSLGYSHWLAAKIAAKQKRLSDATAHLMKARNIFISRGDAAMLTKLEAELHLIEKGDQQ